MFSPTTKISRAARFWERLATPEFPDLGPGPRCEVLPEVTLEIRLLELTREFNLSNPTAELLTATALLYHDNHDPAHNRVEDRGDRDACLIHALLHRREPDYWNAAYWFRRVSGHPIYGTATPAVIQAAQTPEARAVLERLTLSGNLDPLALVQECERMAKRPDTQAIAYLRQVQHLEFAALVEHLLA
jgi:hypothetical protein